MSDEYLTTEQVARELGIPVRTVQHWLKTGELPGFKAGLRQWRIRRSELEAYIRRQSNQAPREERED
jgi:excisionase family DNA binding protein